MLIDLTVSQGFIQQDGRDVPSQARASRTGPGAVSPLDVAWGMVHLLCDHRQLRFTLAEKPECNPKSSRHSGTHPSIPALQLFSTGSYPAQRCLWCVFHFYRFCTCRLEAVKEKFSLFYFSLKISSLQAWETKPCWRHLVRHSQRTRGPHWQRINTCHFKSTQASLSVSWFELASCFFESHLCLFPSTRVTVKLFLSHRIIIDGCLSYFSIAGTKYPTLTS